MNLKSRPMIPIIASCASNKTISHVVARAHPSAPLLHPLPPTAGRPLQILVCHNHTTSSSDRSAVLPPSGRPQPFSEVLLAWAQRSQAFSGGIYPHQLLILNVVLLSKDN